MGISREEALDCYRSDDLIGLGMEADAVRRRLHPENVVSYGVEDRIDCAEPQEAILRSLDDVVESDATAVRISCAAQPHHNVAWFESLFKAIKHRHPGLDLYGLSAAEIIEIAKVSGLDLRATIARLRDAGLDTIAGDGCADHEGWLAVHEAAHRLGLRTTAGLTFSTGETLEHRLDHLASIRRLQNATGGFTAFVPQVAAAKALDEPTAVEYLKTLAIARMFLDNIENIQSSLGAADLKVLQVSFRFGCNDAGNTTAEETLRYAIRDAGFKPAQRDALYRAMFLN